MTKLTTKTAKRLKDSIKRGKSYPSYDGTLLPSAQEIISVKNELKENARTMDAEEFLRWGWKFIKEIEIVEKQ